MPVDKVVNLAPETEVTVIEGMEDMPEIEVVIDEDGEASLEIEPEKDPDFYGNLAENIDETDLSRISLDLLAFYEADSSSRKDWNQMYSKGLELLGLKVEERTQPFRGAAGAVHPMLTEAIVQFQAQAFKELMPAGGPVRTQIMGKETIDKTQQASRVQDFMNYQITTEMKEYTPEFDQLLFYTGYGGSAFKKVYYDHYLGRMVSRLVLPDDLYIPYNGSSVMSECRRITHRLAMDSNDFKKRVVAGEYLDVQVDENGYALNNDQIKEAINRITGISPSGEPEELSLLEFQVDLDIPEYEDTDEKGNLTGIKLPYVVTIDESSGQILRI